MQMTKKFQIACIVVLIACFGCRDTTAENSIYGFVALKALKGQQMKGGLDYIEEIDMKYASKMNEPYLRGWYKTVGFDQTSWTFSILESSEMMSLEVLSFSANASNTFVEWEKNADWFIYAPKKGATDQVIIFTGKEFLQPLRDTIRRATVEQALASPFVPEVVKNAYKKRLARK